MTGYLTVGLIIGLGGYWVLLLACRTRDRGVVHLRFADRMARLACAILDTQRAIGLALEPVMREVARATIAWAESFTKAIARAEEELSASLPDGLHAEYDQTPLLGENA